MIVERNPGIPFDESWIDSAPQSASFDTLQEPASKDDLKSIVSLLDLTSLNSDDTDEKILALIDDALEPLPSVRVNVAAICIYPQFLSAASTWVRERGVKLATVAGSFPHGLGSLDSRCQEISYCAKIADEVDFPIDRRLALEGKWKELYWETKELVGAAPGSIVKVILGTGELPNQQTIYRTAIVAMMAGASFVKTSTGKERVNARLDAGAILCRAIRDYERRTDVKVGLKPAGGIRSTGEAMSWLHLARTKLGLEWVKPDLFRIGASSLLEQLRYSWDST